MRGERKLECQEKGKETRKGKCMTGKQNKKTK